jgi:hypothetical protein
MLHKFHTYATSVLSGYCICLQWFSSVLASVSEACFKCFIYLQTYVASVASNCFKSRLGVAHVAIHVRSGGDASGPRMQSGGKDPTWAHEGGGVLVFLCERGVDCWCECVKL